MDRTDRPKFASFSILLIFSFLLSVWPSAAIEPKSKLPIYSLYGNALRPTREMLRGLDALVFDIQDAGARFYTYITTTMAYAMEESAKRGLKFFVLDRPNPITASAVQGPVMKHRFLFGAILMTGAIASSPMTTREMGAAVGTIGGDAVGGIVGSAVGHPGTGAAAGGAVGLGPER